MRTILHVFLLLQLGASVCVAQWYPQSSGTTRNLNAVAFTDANNGYAVGDSGVILHTSDAGLTWAEQTSGTVNHLYDLCFIDESTGFAIGDSGTILKTETGGSDWSQLSTGRDYALNSVCFVDAATGWVVGGTPYASMPTILHTTNGGMEWSQQTYGDTIWLNDVYFVDVNSGWSVGWRGYPNPYEGIILRTTNGGADWTPQTSGTERVLRDVDFVDENVGWVVGGAIGPLPRAKTSHPVDDGPGIVLKTVDGGLTWTTQMDTLQEALFGVSFVDSSYGFAVGYCYSRFASGALGGTIVYTTDGGVNWMSQLNEDLSGFRDVDFIDANTGWVVGIYYDWDSVSGYSHSGKILHTTNGGVTFVEGKQPGGVPTRLSLSQNYPNPFNPSTTIRYGIPHTSAVQLSVFNTLGQQVATLVQEEKEAGHYEVQFDASGLSSGVYFYCLQAGGVVDVKRLMLLR